MKIIFFGTSSFATTPLISLINSKHKLLAVVTQPDKRSGRGLVKSFSPVKLVSQKYDIPVHQPATCSNAEFLKTLKGLGADLFVVVSFGQILPEEALEIPKIYSINIHSSLLPKYRGAAPINWAVSNGETSTGVTIFKMTKDMDRGDVIAKEEIKIEHSDTALSLNDKLSKVGADLLLETLEAIKDKKVTLTPQDDTVATHAPKLSKKDGLIDWGKTTSQIHNHVRAMIPWPAATTSLNKKRMKLWKTGIPEGCSELMGEPGTIVKVGRDGIIVKTGDGAIAILELQSEGAKRMPVEAYLRGHKLETNQRFT